jgi:hypothetical protein
MKINRSIIILSISAVLTGCFTQKAVSPSANMQVQLNLLPTNMEYIIDTTVTVKQSYVLGIPYGGPRYQVGQLVDNKHVPLKIKRNRAFNRALFEVLKKYPDADFVLPLSYRIEKNIMFLGREEELVLKVKLMRIAPKN